MNGRRIVLIVVAGLALLVAGLAAAVVLIPEERVADAVATRAEAALGETVSIDRVGIALFPTPGVKLSGLTVGRADSMALARLDRLALRVRILPLFGGRVVIRSVDVHAPRIRVEIDQAGVTNLPTLEPDSADRPADRDVAFAIDRVRVADGIVRYTDHRDGTRVRLDGWNQELSVAGRIEAGELASLTLDGQLAFDDVEAELRDAVLPARGLAVRVRHDATLDLDADRLELRALEVDIDGVTVAGSGRVRGVNSGRPDVLLELAADGLDAQRLMAWVPDSLRARLALPDGRQVGLRGTAAIDARVAGTLALDTLPAVDGSLRLDDVSLTLGDDALVDDVAGRAAFSLDSVVGRFDGRLLDQPFNAGAAIRYPADPIAVVAFSGRADLGRMAGLDLVSDSLGLEGDVRIDLRAQVPSRDPAAGRAAGTIELANVAVPGADPAVRVPTATARFDGGRVRLNPVTLELGPDRSPASLDITVDGWIPAAVDTTAPPPRVTAAFQADALDMDRILGPSEIGYPTLLFARLRDRPVEGRSAAEVAAEMGLAVPPLPRVDARVDARIDTLIRNGLTYTDLEVTAAVTPAAIEVEPARFAFMGGRVDLSARVEPRATDSTGAPVRTRVTTRYGLEDVGAGPFFDTLSPFKDHLAGTLAMAGTAGMVLDRHALPERPSVEAEGSIALSDGRLANWSVLEGVGDRLGTTFDTIRFDDWAGRYSIRGTRVALQETVLQGPRLDVQAGGWFDFGGQLDVRTVTTLDPELAARAGAIGQLATGGEPVPVGLRISGPIESPNVALDLTPAREAAAGRGREAVEEATNTAREAAEEAGRQAAEDAAREAEAAARDAAGAAGERVLPDSLRGLPADSLRRILGDSAYEMLPDSVRLRADSLQQAIENAIRERLRRMLPGGGRDSAESDTSGGRGAHP